VIALRLLKDGVVVREALFRALPVTLGRGEACDFPIFDASVSRNHALLEKDAQGALALRDLGSRNGLHLGPRRVDRIEVASRVQCLIGSVELELEPLRAEDTLEIKLHAWDSLERRRGARENLRSLGLGTLGWLATWASEPSFWSPWEKGKAATLLAQALGALVGLPLLAALLMVLLKAFGRRLRLADALDVLARVAWLPPLVNALAFLSYYPLSASGFQAVHGALLVAALAWAAGAAAAVRRPGPSRLFRAAWGVAVLVLAGGLALVAGLNHEKTGEAELDFHVQVPLGAFAGRSESLDAYFTRLSEAVQQAAAEAAAERSRGDQPSADRPRSP
jgi:hypothetical protein